MKRSLKPKGLLVMLTLGYAFFLPTVSMATSILGGSLIVQNTGEVFATFQGSSAGYSSTLFLHNTGQSLFNNHSSSVGTTISLGTFEAGTELVFGINVQNTGQTFFTGGGFRNGDGLAHAMINDTFGQEGEALVSFEDLLGGGDRDYNDLEFAFSNVAGEEARNTDIDGNTLIQNPEPSTVILLGSGLIGLATWRWKKQRRVI